MNKPLAPCLVAPCLVSLCLVSIGAAACTVGRADVDPWRHGWVSLADAIATAATLPLASESDAPLAFRLVLPEDLAEADLEAVHAAYRVRGYEAYHAEPGMVGELTDRYVSLLLAEPVEVDGIDSRKVAERLWLAGIPFATTLGNTCTLVLPRRAVPDAKRCLAGLVAAEDWQRIWAPPPDDGPEPARQDGRR